MSSSDCHCCLTSIVIYLLFAAFASLASIIDNLPVAEVTINRQFVLRELMDYYSSRDVLNTRFKVSFNNENGDDFGGLTREMFTAFWTEAYQTYFHGELQSTICASLSCPQRILFICGNW